jgi:hypothetical protein
MLVRSGNAFYQLTLAEPVAHNPQFEPQKSNNCVLKK